MRSLVIAAISLAQLGLASACTLAQANLADDGVPALREAADRPAPSPGPEPPGIERPEDEQPPATVELPADAAAVGRLRDQDWTADFTFAAKEGDHALFEFTSWGYARGWTSRAALVVRDASGRELARSERAGGTVYQDVLPFVAPADGDYVLSLVAVENGFRYRVIHHGGYTAHRTDERLDVGERDRAHSWIGAQRGDAARPVRLQVTGEPGSTVLVRAEPTDPRGLKQQRGRRRVLASSATGQVDAMAAARMGRRADFDSFPMLALEIEGALAGTDHARVVRVPESGVFEVVVSRTNDGPPGRLDLVVQRDLKFTEASVRAGDLDDEPVSGVTVALLLEPSLDLVALETTGDDGVARVLVPPGDYTVVHSRAGSKPETTRTRLGAGEEINLVVGAR